MSLLNHPDIWKASLVLVIINTIALAVCLDDFNVPGIVVNSIFLVFNGVATIGNYSIRDARRQQRRQFLIDTTIGE